MAKLELGCPQCEYDFAINIKTIDKLRAEIAELRAIIEGMKKPKQDGLEGLFDRFRRV
jgi:hypothetical protein